MATLEQYVAEATQAYQPAQTAIQNQLNSLQGQLDTTNEQINKNYALQQAQLQNQRNDAAREASLQAAATGGSFGGQAAIANKKYYNQSFIPAVAQLRTNQTNELASARQANENQRTSLNSQLSNLQAQANQQALSQYYNDQNLEKQLAEQRRATAAQESHLKYMMEADRQAREAANNQNLKNWNFGDGYYAQEFKDNAGNRYVRYYGHGDQEMDAGDFVWETNQGGTPWDIWNDIWNNGVNTYGINSNDIMKLGGR